MFTFDIPAFRLEFEAFFSDVTYPDCILQGFWDSATLYIANANYGYLSGPARYRAIVLMVAHLATLSDLISKGQTPGMVQSSTVDKVSVTLTPPPNKTQFAWWLNLTGYGQQLAALLHVKAVGGFFIAPSACRPRGFH